MSSPPDPTSDEIKLGELLAVFQERRADDRSIGVGSMREEAGELFPELAELAECLGILGAGVGEAVAEIPATVGPYDIEAELGAGISGVVYRARRDGKHVALKVMRESLALSTEAMQRFQREITIASKLDHDHIVKLLGHGEAQGRLFLAMELVDGCSLAELLQQLQEWGEAPCDEWLAILDRWNIPPSDGADPAEIYARRMAALFAPVASALAHAQQRGLIHRDLKPGNLLLGTDGRLRVADFGLAKIIGEEITSTVAVLGTPGFMSPEQASGQSRSVDVRSDVYGLGATLYRALTMHFPVEADSFGEVLAAIMTQRPKPIGAAYPRALDLVLSRCLEKEPDDRYQDAALLADDLQRVAEGKTPRIGRVPAARRAKRYLRKHRRTAAVAAAAILVGVSLAAWLLFGPVTLEVHAYPAARVAFDGVDVGDAPWEDSVARGSHRLKLTREGFVEHDAPIRVKGSTTLQIHLRPVEPFGELTVLADAYGRDADLPAPARPRGRSDEPYAIKVRDPQAFAARVAEFPEDVRAEPFVHLFAVQQLLKDGLYPEAYHAALELTENHPGQEPPLRLALAALDQLGLADRAVYADLFAKLPQEDPRDRESKHGKVATPGRDRALLVGCTEYPNLKSSPHYESSIRLYGPANDVDLMAETLREFLGVTDINTLKGWPDDAAARPTRENILGALDRFAADAKKGDRVIVFFAGHGSQQPDKTRDELDRMDEILLPADVKGWSGKKGNVENAISDDELGKKLRAIRDRGAIVWLMLDCCHAGSGVRGASERGRGVHPSLLGVPDDRIPRGRGEAPIRQESLENIVALYGAQSHRLAPEIKLPRGGGDDARWHGLFTWVLASQLRQSGGGLSFRELHARVLASYRTQYQGTAPQAEGELDLFVAGGGRAERPPLLLRREKDGIVLDAGRLAGIENGTVLAALDGDGGRVGLVRVTKAGLSRSACEGELAADLATAEIVSTAVGDFRLRVGGAVPEAASRFAVAAKDPDWIVEAQPDGGALLRGRGVTLRAAPGEITARLHDLFRAENLKRLSELVGPPPEGLRVTVGTVAGGVLAPGGALRPGDEVYFTLENATDQVFDVTILVIDAEYGINELFPGRDESPRLEAHSEEQTKGPFIVNDATLGVENILVIAVPRQAGEDVAWFGWLEQRSIPVQRGHASPLGDLLAAMAFGKGAQRGAEVKSDVAHASLLTWRTEWGAVGPPAEYPAEPQPIWTKRSLRDAPNPYEIGPRGCTVDGMTIAGGDKPRHVLLDIDGDEDPEIVLHFLDDRRIAFYDTDNSGEFDLILMDDDNDPDADKVWRDGWQETTRPWLQASNLENGAEKAVALLRKLRR